MFSKNIRDPSKLFLNKLNVLTDSRKSTEELRIGGGEGKDLVLTKKQKKLRNKKDNVSHKTTPGSSGGQASTKLSEDILVP